MIQDESQSTMVNAEWSYLCLQIGIYLVQIIVLTWFFFLFSSSTYLKGPC